MRALSGCGSGSVRRCGARRWWPRRLGPLLGVPGALRPWLDEPGSLTRRLRQAAPGRLEVDVVYEGWGRPWRDEARRLGIDRRRRVWVREVVLGCRGEAWIRARTVIPASALRGPLRRLRQLGSRPLGSVLFGHYPLVRGPIQVAWLRPGDALHAAAGLGSDQGLWARRSVFRIRRRRMLVSEVFLPALPGSAGSGWRR